MGNTQVIYTGQLYRTDRDIPEHAEYIHTRADYKQDTGGKRDKEFTQRTALISNTLHMRAKILK